MSTITFTTDSTTLAFALKYDSGNNKLEVGGSKYDKGSVVYNNQLTGDIQLTVSNGSAANWELETLEVKLITGEDPNKQTYQVTMTHRSSGDWVGTLPKRVATAAQDGRLHVTATWVPNGEGGKEQRDDPVIIVNPKNSTSY